MTWIRVSWLGVLLALGMGAITHGQTATCPAIIEQAVAARNAFCSNLENGSVCYGYPSVELDLNAETPPTLAPGVRIPVEQVNALQTESFNLFTGEWGLLQMRVEAGLPDDSTYLDVFLFGGTELRNESLNLRYSATPNVVSLMRPLPSTNNQALLRLDPGIQLTVIGRNEASDWVRVVTADERTGWVFAELLDINGAVADLPVFADADLSLESADPMEVITLRSELNEAPCPQAEYSGVLLQSTTDTQPASMTINGVALRLQGTAFVEALWGDGLTVYLLDGQSLVSSSGGNVLATAGTQARVALDADGLSAGEPNLTPYDLAFLGSLPLNMLESRIALLPALTQAELEERKLATQRPTAGIWRMVAADAAEGCPSLPLAVGTQIVVEVLEDGDLLLDGALRFLEQDTQDEPDAANYLLEDNAADRIEVISPTYFVRRTTVLGGDCVLTSEFQLDGA